MSSTFPTPAPTYSKKAGAPGSSAPGEMRSENPSRASPRLVRRCVSVFCFGLRVPLGKVENLVVAFVVAPKGIEHPDAQSIEGTG